MIYNFEVHKHNCPCNRAPVNPHCIATYGGCELHKCPFRYWLEVLRVWERYHNEQM